MSTHSVRILGGGVTAALTAACFEQAGWSVEQKPCSAAAVPLVTLNESTLGLIDDYFDKQHGQQLRLSGHRILRRVVIWGAEPDSVAVNALLVRAPAICRVTERVMAGAHAEPSKVIGVRGRQFNSGQAVGARFAFIWPEVPVSLSDEKTCFTVAVDPYGWAYLAPKGSGSAMFQVILSENNLEMAMEVAHAAVAKADIGQTVNLDDCDVLFGLDASPRLRCCPGDCDIGVGDEVMALDPLCGDGIGYAIRSAILQIALLQNDTLSVEARNTMYYQRLRRSFIKHLEVCENFYSLFDQSLAWNRINWSTRKTRLRLSAQDQSESRSSYTLIRDTLIVN